MLKQRRGLHNEKGFATLEMIPIIVVIALLLNFSLGFYGVIQSALLNSIAARNYAFETFRNRTNLLYFHDVRGNEHFKKYNSRVHSIASEGRASSDGTSAVATMRRIGYQMNPEGDGDISVHEPGSSDEAGIFGIKEKTRNQDISAAPVWVRPMYGICLNAKCEQ